jgi:NAD(P)-dependent dehydrogenase (short-subunit alcohol dehydrogenase family)
MGRRATFDLRGKRCLITGAASGIGRATAIAAAREGAELVLTDIRADELRAVADAVRRSGGVVLHAAAADVSDYEAVRAIASDVEQAHGSMDVVMNVAGISTWGTVDRLSHEQWRRQVDVNLMGPIHVIECFVPAMIEAGRGGHLVNVASAAALFGFPWHAPYSAAKFGLRGVSEVLRFDLRRHGIGVSLVCPGGVDTGLVGTLDIAGVDRSDPRVARHTALFRKHAVSPERAAEAILDGVRRRRYMVYTSRDIQLGFWFQRKFAWPYELAMRVANRQFNRVLGGR